VRDFSLYFSAYPFRSPLPLKPVPVKPHRRANADAKIPRSPAAIPIARRQIPAIEGVAVPRHAIKMLMFA